MEGSSGMGICLSLNKPNNYNPSEGFFATANQNVTPDDYEHWDAIGFSWSDPYRGDRANEVLSAGSKMTMEDMRGIASRLPLNSCEDINSSTLQPDFYRSGFGS